jgi:hypothetical protein
MALDHCLECNSTMKSDETICWACGSAARQKDAPTGLGQFFSSTITVLFYISAGITVASLFFDATPPFTKCIIVTLILLFVKSSAAQMLEKKKK